jgi:hypothetical protein
VDSEQAGRAGETGGGGLADERAPSPGPVGGSAPPADTPAAGPARAGGPPPPRGNVPKTRWLPFVIILLCAAAAASFLYVRHRRGLLGGLKTGAEQVKDILTGAPPRDPYAEAVSKMEEDRGEPTGRKAQQVEIPEELKQYKETRRFLAIQGAAAAEAGVKSPHDFAELAEAIRAGHELVEVPRLGKAYVLYGVGLTATGALTHYDLKARKVVPLFSGVEELEAFEGGLAADRARLGGELKELDEKLKGLGRKEREERARLLAESAARKKELSSLADKEKLLAEYYGRPGAKDRARAGGRLFAEYESQAALARDFGGRAYDLRDAATAREFQARMLSFLRPPALALLEELAAAYQSKFERPLPVTSLVRTEEYQRLLRESGNPNAADVAPPPHTTGLAFDVYYRYMTAAEQEFVMAEIARLEREGRVEALRELRDHYHVFVFAAGHPPPAEAVDRILGKRTKREEPEKPERAQKPDKKKPQETKKPQKPQAKEKQPKKGKRR